MGARLIDKNNKVVKKVMVKSAGVITACKKQYERVNGVLEPTYYDGYVLYNKLKGDGTAYINLGHKGDSTHRYELDFEYQLDAAYDAIFKAFFGARTANQSKEISVTKGNTLQSAVVMQYGTSNGTRKLFTLDHLNHRYKISISKSSFSVNIDGTTSTTANTLTTNFTTLDNLTVFNILSISYPSAIAVHFVKEYDANNVLLYHYVPARRQADNTLGLLDVVNGVFYTNAASSGGFTV